MTSILHAATISNVESVLREDRVRKMVNHQIFFETLKGLNEPFVLITKLRFRSDKELPRIPLGQDISPKSVAGLSDSQGSMYTKSLQQQIAGKYN